MAKADIQAIDQRVKWWLLVSSLVTLILMIVAALQENIFPQWRRTRLQYASILWEKADDDRGRSIADQFKIVLDQNVLPELHRVDRCITCHAGADDPRMADQDKDKPFRTHSGDFLANHPPEKYGCTICHQGQGRATSLPDAHGDVPYWPEPLLTGAMAYTSCGRCHYENDLYGGQADLFGEEFRTEEVTRGELASHVAGADAIARGKQLVVQRGCLGCHRYRDRGGNLGPDITYVGDKTVHDFVFENVSGEHTVLNWLTGHFKSPASVVPETLMPDLGLSDEEAHDLAVYMIGLKRKLAYTAYTPMPRPVDPTPAGGETLYGMFCSSCHGADGIGAIARMAKDSQFPDLQAIDRPRELLTPSIRNPDTLAVASDDYLRYIIGHGRSGTGMSAWDGNGGLSQGEIERLVATIRGWQSEGPPTESIAARRGDAARGRALYRTRCMGCHGPQGEGGVGVSLSSLSFLAVASDEFLRDAILRGRPNTAMPSWKDLTADQTSDLIAYIRAWQPQPADVADVLRQLAATPQPSPQSLYAGRILYGSNCGNCHGRDGAGDLGPSLRTDEFLSLANDHYLATAIVGGRPDTAMPAWRHLTTKNVVDLIHYLRAFNGGNRRQIESFMAHGDWDRGELLFKGICAACHGQHAEGGTGPQLANPTFLQTVSDEMLREWISFGKQDTPMRSFIREEQGLAALSASQIEDIVTWLRRNQDRARVVTARPGMGIPALGAEVYARTCSECHGERGEGRVGSALSNSHFLRSANDGYLAATMILGRDDSPMVSVAGGQQGIVDLSAEDVANVVAHLRTWEYQPPPNTLATEPASEADQESGRELYLGHCAGCHGDQGKGGWAPELNNPQFVTAASNGFLQGTIARGRSGTAMRPFGKGSGGVASLGSGQIKDIVSYLRSWQQSSP
jgi:mono/diheme cytochrome c family protein